jgi:hypothetical protein
MEAVNKNKVRPLIQLLAAASTIAVPLAGWYAALAFAFGRFEFLWTLPPLLMVCIGLGLTAVYLQTGSLPDERRFMTMTGYLVAELILMLGAVFMFEADQSLFWKR